MIILLTTLFFSQAATIDSVRSVVNNENIIASEIAIEEVIHKTDNATETVWLHNEKGPHERLIMSALLRTKAETLDLYEPTEDVLFARAERIRTQMGDNNYRQFLNRHGLNNPADLLSILRKRIIAERFVARNISVPTANIDQWHHELELLLIDLRASVHVRNIATEE